MAASTNAGIFSVKKHRLFIKATQAKPNVPGNKEVVISKKAPRWVLFVSVYGFSSPSETARFSSADRIAISRIAETQSVSSGLTKRGFLPRSVS